MQDAWRAYLELAMGLTEAPRKRAQDAVRRLVGNGGATAGQIQALAEELVSTGAANREALTKLVRFEVDRALGAVGLATSDEVAELTRRVHELERQLREAKGSPGALAAGPPPTGSAPAGGSVPPTGSARSPRPKEAAAPVATPGVPDSAASGGGSDAAAARAADDHAAGSPGAGRSAGTPGGSGAAVPTPAGVVAKKAVAKKAVAKKAVARKPPAVLSTTDDTAPAARPVKRAAPRKSADGTP
ncbi:hypothetical protein ACFY3U_22765 [Micromonospora sp. NPDC000089]|uniref:phasin family protein n=1 Tax=unclassified Micromonospora TaxID=2617518 RepID=UPI0036BC238B